MLMIIAESADTTGSATPAIVLAVLGVSGGYTGARWAFNLRGAADTWLQRRRIGLELKGQQRGDLALADSDPLGPKFIRLLGAIIVACGVMLCLASLAFAVDA